MITLNTDPKYLSASKFGCQIWKIRKASLFSGYYGKKNPTNPHYRTLICDYLPSVLRRKPQVWHWCEERGNRGIHSTNLWNILTNFYALYWEVEGKNNYTKMRQKTQATFCLHSITYASVKQELEGGNSVNIRHGITSPPWGWLPPEIWISY